MIDQVFGILISVVIMVVLFASIFWALAQQPQQSAAMQMQYPDYRLSEVARRTHLSIVEGDPALNFLLLAYTPHWLQPTRETRARLCGSPNGRPTELVYCHRTEPDPRFFASKKWIETLDGRFTLRVARPFAPFEVVLRSPGYLGSPPVMSLPPVSLGDPVLDAKFVLSTHDPSMANALAPALALLAALGFLHICASEQSISYAMTTAGAPYVIYSIELIQYALEQIASTLEGRSDLGVKAS